MTIQNNVMKLEGGYCLHKGMKSSSRQVNTCDEH